MLKIDRVLQSNRQSCALIGMRPHEFALLLPTFIQLLYEHFASKKRQRAVGGGRKGALVDAKSKLFFILFYLKVYPTYDLAGFIFGGVNRSRCFRWVEKLLPILEKTLGRSITMPKRKISSMEELLKSFPELQDVFIDATERKTQRPKKAKLAKKRYSGKKKMHSRKNTIICDKNRKIIFVSPTKEGRIHDLVQLKKTGTLDCLPKHLTLWVDKGYQGIKKLIDNKVMIPYKKPKGRPLAAEQKQENRLMSGIRIIVEHAINGIKRFGCLSNIYRNKKGQDDAMVMVCSALWNFHLQHSC